MDHMVEVLSGQDLIDAGMAQGKWFRDALNAGNDVLARGGSHAEAITAARGFEPPPAIPLREQDAVPFHVNIEAGNAHELANVEAVSRSEMFQLVSRIATFARVQNRGWFGNAAT